MKQNYYFLAASLPELAIGYPADITFGELDFKLKTFLSPEDYHKTVVLRRYLDLENIRAFWAKEPLDPRGNYDVNELEDALLTHFGLPEYVYAYLDQYEHKEERLRHFSALMGAYFNHEIAQADGFLKEFLIFEREMRLVFTGFRAKKQGRDLAKELQYEDPNDDIIAQILAQKDAKTYEPPTSFGELKFLFEEYGSLPLELHKALYEYRFQKFEEMYGVDIFSIDRILVYLAQLIMVEKWMELDKKQGLEVIETIVKEAK